MKCCIVFEIAGPCRWPKYESAGRYKRILFAWFSIAFLPYKWTEFLDRYASAVMEVEDEQL